MSQAVGSDPRQLVVNGRILAVENARPTDRLLDVLRRAGLRGAREACSRGECGSCTVLVDGRPVMSCLVLVGRVDGQVETVEGLAEEARELLEAFADEGAFQCGFCTPGQIVRAVALLRDGLPNDDLQLRRILSGNICRCTGYAAITAAIRQAATGRVRE